MHELFTESRTHSLTRPDNPVGMHVGFPQLVGKRHFTRQDLENKIIELYEDDFLIKLRGERSAQEEYVLQGLTDGKWVTIKQFRLLPGQPPEPHYGHCPDCGKELEESEFAIGIICSGCVEKVEAARVAATW